jgi:hypothetical protein
MQKPSSTDFLRLHLTAICSIGLSGTAFFLVPFIIGASLLSSKLARWNQPDCFRNMLLIGTTLIPFAIIAALIKVGFLPEILNTDVWHLSSYPEINEHLRPEIVALKRTIFAKKTTIYFYLISVLGLLFFPWRNKLIKEFGIATLFICILLVLPPFSSILIKITLDFAYWRLAYATQMLLVIGIFILLCLTGENGSSARKKITLRIFGIFFFVLFILLKSPSVKSEIIFGAHQFKISPAHMEVARLLENWAPDKSTALIPDELLSAVGLLRPDIAFVCVHRLETLHVFSNAGRKDEALRRISARDDLRTCGTAGEVAKILSEIPTLNLLIFPSACDPKTVENNTQLHREEWNVKSTVNYQVWLKNVQQ